MTATLRPDLADADGVEITHYLMGLGWTEVRTELDDLVDPPALWIAAANPSTRSLDADLSEFVPTAARGEYVTPLAPTIRAEAVRIRDDAALTDAQLDAAFPAGPQRRLAYGHRAVCRAMVWLVDRRLGE